MSRSNQGKQKLYADKIREINQSPMAVFVLGVKQTQYLTIEYKTKRNETIQEGQFGGKKSGNVPSEDSSEDVTERLRRFLEKRSRLFSSVTASLFPPARLRLWPRRCCDSTGLMLLPLRFIVFAVLCSYFSMIKIQRRERKRDFFSYNSASSL